MANKKTAEPEITVMMMGARRVGKTSMLASMYNSFNTVAAGTNLIMSKKGGIQIDDARYFMDSLFKESHMALDPLGWIDGDGTPSFDEIDFELSISGKGNNSPKKSIRFIDCAGEWFNEHSNEDDFKEKLENCEAVIIAVDSVLLMENHGAHQRMNAPVAVTEYIKNYFNPDAMTNSKKMVIFVPTKCEKYMNLHENPNSAFYGKKMSELTRRIKEEYKELFDFLECPANKSLFTVAIMPAITLGGIEFDQFAPEAKGGDLCTNEILYRYCKECKYKPRYCEFPLLYTLLFVNQKIAKHYYETAYKNGKKKLGVKISEWFDKKRNLTTDPEFIAELNKVAQKLQSYPGFELVQDPDGIAKTVQPPRK